MKQKFPNSIDEFLSLAEAAEQTGYHQDYLGFLCRQGELQGIKIGRNWVISKAALQEFVENRKENVYLSLAEASAETGYHQDYLGFLCRQGKLPGRKIGRNWVIKKEDLYGFAESDENKLSEVVDETGVKIPVKVVKAVPQTGFPAAHNELTNLRANVLEEIEQKVRGISENLSKIEAGMKQHQEVPLTAVIAPKRDFAPSIDATAGLAVKQLLDSEGAGEQKFYASFLRRPAFGFADASRFAMAGLIIVLALGVVLKMLVPASPKATPQTPAQKSQNVVYQNYFNTINNNSVSVPGSEKNTKLTIALASIWPKESSRVTPVPWAPRGFRACRATRSLPAVPAWPWPQSLMFPLLPPITSLAA